MRFLRPKTSIHSRSSKTSFKMPTLRSSTRKQRANLKPRTSRPRKQSIRREIVETKPSSCLIDPSLGNMSYLPFEVRQAIYEHVVPPETPPTAAAGSFMIGDKPSDDKTRRLAAQAPIGLVALLCTSKAISAEVKRSFQNREYQVSFSNFGIAFEAVRSTIELRCFCFVFWPTRTKCNHCKEGLFWKVGNSLHNKPLRRCSALKCLRRTLPAMRRLHVTFTNGTVGSGQRMEFVRRISSAGRISDILHQGKLAGLELRLTCGTRSIEPGNLAGERFFTFIQDTLSLESQS